MKKLSLVLSMVLFSVVTMLAQRTINGTITDDTGEALIGATVLVKGTTNGTVTDFDGNFELNVPEDATTLVVTYTGFSTQEVPMTASNSYNVQLSEGVALNEVVVTALGIEREEKSLGYAVTNLDGEELSQSKETNVVNALSGKIAGVQISGAPSALGGSSRITIRGANSFLGNNQPLFVIDGIPIDNGNGAVSSTESGQQRGFGGSVAYDYGNAAQDIDPESIASVTVLKGAAATALYGQRGANGVIQIITKDGSSKKGLGIEVSNQMNFDNVRNLIPHQQQYGGGSVASSSSGFFEVIDTDGITYLTPAYAKDGAWGPKYNPSTLVRHWDSWDPDNPATYRETRPWDAPNATYEDFFETGVTRTTNVAFTGSDERGSFRLGYTNLGGTGTMPNSNLDRNSFNLKSAYNLSDKVKATVTGNYIRTEGQGRNVTGYNNGNPMQAFTQWWQTQLDIDRLREGAYLANGNQQTWNPIGAVVNDDRELLFFNHRPRFFDNPYWVRENYLQEDIRDRLIGGAALSVDLGKGFSVMGRVGTDFYNTSARAGIPIESVETSLYQERELRFTETNLEARINYKNNFSERISFNAFLGGNRMRQLNYDLTAQTAGGLALDRFYNISNSASAATTETREFRKGINSVFGSASFGWDNWLYLDFTARNDWSSTLPANDNSYFYPSITLSGVLSDLLNLDYTKISFLKVRASYASAGNDADPYGLMPTFAPQTPNFLGSSRYSVPTQKPNPNLKPEYTTEYEFGIDAKFFSNRLGVDVAYFNRRTTDQIFPVPSSSSTGFTSRILNSGEMMNSGIELQVSATPVQTNDFSWNVAFNVSKLNNEVVSLADGVESINMGGTWAADLRVQEGQKYMALYGQDYLYNDNGDRLIDQNGAYMFTDDRVFLGSALADWVGGFNTGISFKGITLSGLMDFQFGGIMHSTSLQWAKYSGMHPETVEYNGQTGIRENGVVFDGISEESGQANTVAIDPLTYYQTYWRRAAPNVFKSDFVKLREIRASYRIPNRLIEKAGIRDLTIALTGRNLAILHADIPFIDPQVVAGSGNLQGLENAQIPPTRTLGFNISFKL